MSKFIQNFTEKTIEKDKRFTWKDEYQKAFDYLKDQLTSDDILKFYDPCDRSIGVVLFQKDDDGYNRPITYIS